MHWKLEENNKLKNLIHLEITNVISFKFKQHTTEKLNTLMFYGNASFEINFIRFVIIKSLIHVKSI